MTGQPANCEQARSSSELLVEAAPEQLRTLQLSVPTATSPSPSLAQVAEVAELLQPQSSKTQRPLTRLSQEAIPWLVETCKAAEVRAATPHALIAVPRLLGHERQSDTKD